MDVRLDTPFESWGGFSTAREGAPVIYGLLRYDPTEGISLTLVDSPGGNPPILFGGQDTFPILLGRLVDGTAVSLFTCLVTKASIQLGVGIGAPTTLHVTRALLGCHVTHLDELEILEYATELSSLASWTCAAPVKVTHFEGTDAPYGFDLTCRLPDPIVASPQTRDFTLEVRHSAGIRSGSTEFSVGWRAAVVIVGGGRMTLDEGERASVQCRNLFSLLTGHHVSVRALHILPADATLTDDHRLNVSLLYAQRGRHNYPDVDRNLMLLPYDALRAKFPDVVARWFDRPEQAVLATNTFFGAQYLDHQSVNARFLSVAQAAESYHRSLGAGVYMDEAAYVEAIAEFTTHMPATFSPDHRQSLKTRLRWGNEYALRRRFNELFARLPGDVRGWISTDPERFVERVVDTRNYWTHYDSTSRAKAFEPEAAYFAAERLRVLVIANLLLDLGVEAGTLLAVLKRSQEFLQIMLRPLPLA